MEKFKYYILSGQKLIKKAKNSQFGELKLAVKQCYQTGQFSQDKNWWEMPKVEKFKWDILGDFQTTWGIRGTCDFTGRPRAF